MLLIGARQHGVVGRAELVEAGLSPARIDRARKSRRLLPVFRGVYAVGREIETVEAVWQAATIAGGEGAALTGRSAAEAWGMMSRRARLPREVEIARPGDPGVIHARSPSLPNTRLTLRRRHLLDDEVSRYRGIPLTTPARTFIDLAGDLGPTQLRGVFIEACRLGRIRRGDLNRLFARSRGRPGAERVRRIAGLWVPGMERTRSVLEGLFLLGWVEADSRVPEVNVRVGRYEVDFLWRREGVIVETDGRAYHDHEIARRRDERKDAWLRGQGLTVIRLGYHDVNGSMPASCALVRQELDREGRGRG